MPDEKNIFEKKPLVEKLESMISYQNGSVVSRELIRKKFCTVTLFSFDKGQGLSEHTAPFDAMVFIVEGKAEIFISGKKFFATKGETITMPAGKPHSLNAVEKFKMLLTMARE